MTMTDDVKVRTYDQGSRIEYDPGGPYGFLEVEIGDSEVKISTADNYRDSGIGEITVPMAEFIEVFRLIEKRLFDGLQEEQP